jgi:hypothetical protein
MLLGSLNDKVLQDRTRTSPNTMQCCASSCYAVLFKEQWQEKQVCMHPVQTQFFPPDIVSLRFGESLEDGLCIWPYELAITLTHKLWPINQQPHTAWPKVFWHLMEKALPVTVLQGWATPRMLSRSQEVRPGSRESSKESWGECDPTHTHKTQRIETIVCTLGLISYNCTEWTRLCHVTPRWRKSQATSNGVSTKNLYGPPYPACSPVSGPMGLFLQQCDGPTSSLSSLGLIWWEEGKKNTEASK